MGCQRRVDAAHLAPPPLVGDPVTICGTLEANTGLGKLQLQELEVDNTGGGRSPTPCPAPSESGGPWRRREVLDPYRQRNGGIFSIKIYSMTGLIDEIFLNKTV